MATEPATRVLHIAAGNLYGGVEVVLATLARHRNLCARSRHAFALCYEGRLARELDSIGAAPLLLGPARVRKPWSVLRARAKLSRALRDFDLAVCHSAWAHALFASVIRRASLGLVTFLHNETSGQHWLERWSRATLPDLVVCNSEFTRRGAELAFPGIRSLVWYPAVPARGATQGQQERLRQELGVSDEAVLIAQVGRFERLKGHERHLNALARLRPAPPWHCVQVGEPQAEGERVYLQKLRRRAERLGIDQRVSFVGFRSDVSEILGAADIYCQPNIGAEAFGLSLAEALGAGLPIVTSRLGAAPELLGDSGIFADDERELAEALQALVDSPSRRRERAEAARARWSALCDPERQIPALDAVLAAAGA